MFIELLNLYVGDAEPGYLYILNYESHLLVHRLRLDNYECSVEKFIKIELSERVCETYNLKLTSVDS